MHREPFENVEEETPRSDFPVLDEQLGYLQEARN